MKVRLSARWTKFRLEGSHLAVEGAVRILHDHGAEIIKDTGARPARDGKVLRCLTARLPNDSERSGTRAPHA